MPLAFLIAGVLFIVTAVKGTQNELAAQVQKDFTGAGNFFYWIGLVIALGIIGQASGFKKTSEGLIILVELVFIISRQGLFAKFVGAMNVGAPASVDPVKVGEAQTASGTPGSGGGGASPATPGGGGTPAAGGGGTSPATPGQPGALALFNSILNGRIGGGTGL